MFNKVATIVIEDEVNCQIKGLDSKILKLLWKKYQIPIPGARFMPAVKLGRWSGNETFFQNPSGKTFISLLYEILPILEENGYDFEIDDKRTYNRNFQFDLVDENSFADSVWPKGHLLAGQPIILRDYQVNIINTFLKNTEGIQIAATGSGKTLVTAALSKILEQYGRTIVIVPSKDLVGQTEQDYINLGLDVGVFFGERKEYGKTHTICTWQSLNSLMKQGKKNIEDDFFSIQEFLHDVVGFISDETHGSKAAAMRALLGGVMAKIPIRWGVTGTFPKDPHDQLIIKTLLGDVIGSLPSAELREQGVLSQCDIIIKQLQDVKEFKNYASELKYLVTDYDRMSFIASIIKPITQTGNTLILVDRIAAGKLLLEFLPDAVFIEGAVSTEDRKAQYKDVATSTNKIIIATSKTASVGINIPRIFNLVMIESGKSFIKVIQSIGRALRKANDKNHSNIYDITSSCKFSKRHLAARKSFYKEEKLPFTIEKIIWQ